MGAIINHIFFFLCVLPVLLLDKGIHMLNAKLEKRGYPKLDMLYLVLIGLFLLLFLLLALGYRL